MSQHDETRSQLEKRLRQLTSRIGKIEHDLRTLPSPDSGERAVELENDEVLQQLDEQSLAEARQIQEALGRLRDGSYGLCNNCGGAIGASRLAAVPTAVNCRACAS